MSILFAFILQALAAGPEEASGDTKPTIWEEIQGSSGVLLSDEDREAAMELAEERFDEQRFVGAGVLSKQTDLGIYTDPRAALQPDPLHLSKVAPAEFDIPIVVNDMVEKWMRYFLGSGRKWYTRYLARSTRYHPMMWSRLDAAGLPRDLVYLSMIESGYSNQARSVASAVGLWQFMAPTGRAYGLRVDYWADERVDPEKSTDAAIAYLSDLFELQGDWYLAWASYNAGPGRVNAAAKKHGTRNFWVIAAQETLAEETRNYVPKLIAAAIIGKHPERYGFTEIEYQDELRYQSVEVQGSVTVDVLARCAGVTEQDILKLNPALLRGSTPPQGSTDVRIPEGTAEAFMAAIEKIPPSERMSYQRHTVGRGESLGGIATRYGVSSSEIAKLNRISNPNLIYVGMELIIPVPGMTPELGPAPAEGTTTRHTVRNGDTLAAIATRYGVTVAQLVEWNDLGNADHITVGQQLVIHGANPQRTTQLIYTVKAGDTLGEIASQFGVTVSQVMAWNGIKDPNNIRPGQTLKLYGPSQDWTTYVVQRGDSLGLIAQRNGCTVSDLKEWNDLASTTIHPGQKLRIRED